MLNRRQFLQNAACAGVAATAFSTPLVNAQSQNHECSLRVYNIHTGESLTATFWADGHFIDEEIMALDIMLRDHRANIAYPMDRELYHRLYELQTLFNRREPLYLVSGYRAPSTNRQLRGMSDGVAENSLHTQGRAIDLRIPGVSHRHLHKAALNMKAGGVGYYPESGYVHIDTGRIRHWRT